MQIFHVSQKWYMYGHKSDGIQRRILPFHHFFFFRFFVLSLYPFIHWVYITNGVFSLSVAIRKTNKWMGRERKKYDRTNAWTNERKTAHRNLHRTVHLGNRTFNIYFIGQISKVNLMSVILVWAFEFRCSTYIYAMHCTCVAYYSLWKCVLSRFYKTPLFSIDSFLIRIALASYWRNFTKPKPKSKKNAQLSLERN